MVKGATHSESAKRKISLAHTGKPWSAARRRRAIESPQKSWNKGKTFGPLSSEQRQRLSEAHRRTMKPFTAERRQKISAALKARHIGGVSVGEHRVRARLEADGCEVIRTGWPDFLVVNRDGSLRAVEVKRPYGRLSKQQERVIALLRQVGLPVEVVYESNQRESHS